METITRATLHQTIDELPESALEVVARFLTWLRDGWRTEEAKVGDVASQTAHHERRAKIHTEALAWRAMPEETRRAYGDAFVAVHDGKVIDHDADRLTLFRRVRQKMGQVPVLITPANANHPREIRVLTPHFERLS